ncbi:enoyl-[acyl-carrier-protein] reductase FabK [Heliobacterium undosum]|uniref:Probable nitronate monooxygenase n=1 Tax=Heliomicrobium undosum TaxID=121734 RepID=A0A845L210_9FIRM|nr:enoyl-[acyl-carrier-protein] reductase FabK [Heliomicrobium undosum]MZP29079.1 enoyl-[acyl-carrier-protein] reductase FabK [Heliomicrobium undosum]
MRTVLCDLLGIRYPVLQGGMAWVATAELAAAVSEAGGLGIVGAGQAPAEWLDNEIKKIKARTSKPFGVNVMLMSPHVDAIINLIIEHRVPVITTGAGNPGKYIPRLKEIGTKVIPVVSAVALAQRLEKSGVDALIAEGMESGGHVGELTTMALVPQIVDAVKIPVIAAGGIADGRQFAAALSLGAVGVQMGTRFMCATECTIHQNVKSMVLKAKDRDTVVTGRPTGHPVRVLKNKLVRQFEELERRAASAEELEALGVGKLRKAMVEGDVEMGSVMAGQVAAMVCREQSAAEIIEEIIAETGKVLVRMGGMAAGSQEA